MTMDGPGRQLLLTLLGVLLLVVVLLSLMPLVVEVALENWLVERGADSAEIDDVDLDLFTATASVEGLEVRLDDRTVLAEGDAEVDLAWEGLFQREAIVENAVLRGVSVEVEVRSDGRVRVGSFVVGPDGSGANFDSAASREPWWIRVEQLVLEDGRFRFIGYGLDLLVELDSARLEDLFTLPAERTGRVRLRGRVNGAPMTLDARIDRRTPGFEIAGGLSLDALEMETVAPPLRGFASELSGAVSVAGDFSVRRDGSGGEVRYSGSAQARRGRLGTAALMAEAEAARWEGEWAFSPGNSKSPAELQIEGLVRGEGLRIELHERALRAESDRWSLEGGYQVAGFGESGSAAATFQAVASPARLVDLADDVRLAAAEDLVASGVRGGDDGELDVDELELATVVIGDPEAGTVGSRFESVTIQGFQWHPNAPEKLAKVSASGVRMSEADRLMLENVLRRLGISFQ